MPRIRSLKPEHKQHRKVGPLSDRDYRLWVGMITEADDDGRLVADAAQLRVLIFGYHPQVGVEKIEAGVILLAGLGLIRLYTVDGVRYADFPSWADHQRINRPSESKLPPYNDSMSVHGALSESPLTAHAGAEGSGAEGKGSRRGEERKGSIASIPELPGFTRWWGIYPNKIGKAKALEEWTKQGLEAKTDEVVTGTERTMAYLTRENGKFIPNPATFLHQGRWTDEPKQFQPLLMDKTSGNAAAVRAFVAAGKRP